MKSSYKITKTSCLDNWQLKLWDAAQEEIKNLVRELHIPDAEYPNMCEHCTGLLKRSGYVEYPCPTIKALDGEQ